MESMKTNVGSFATAKLQAKMRSIFAILAITLVFTMTAVGCGDNSADDDGNKNGSGGTFKLTGIPSEYNGKFALLSGQDNISSAPTIVLFGCQNINVAKISYTLCLISNGSVSMPMWSRNSAGGNVTRYSGNHTCTISVFLYNSQTLLGSEVSSQQIGALVFGNLPNSSISTVIFASGSATKSWNDGYYMPKQ